MHTRDARAARLGARLLAVPVWREAAFPAGRERAVLAMTGGRPPVRLRVEPPDGAECGVSMIRPCTPGTVPPVSEDLDSVLLPGDSQAAVLVDVDLLLAADSPRLEGESLAHTCMLAGLGPALPPIVVHRDTMRVIDGMHRLRAAVLRGDAKIEARFFDGSAEAAFVAGVKANIAHGLPLSVADRRAAARRILGSHPQWSDRAIAASAGLDAKTVSAIRRATEDLPQLDTRVGRDGRVRPLDAAAGRRRAADLISTRPDASLRQIAAAAGVSAGTARDVRERIRKSEDPATANGRGPGRPAQPAPGDRAAAPGMPARQRAAASHADPAQVLARLQALKRDPALRYTQQGRDILRWLDAHIIRQEDRTAIGSAIPPHCIYLVAEIALGCAAAWKQLAAELQHRGQNEPGDP
jgi:ParB-like chromosome segregation protein Spo0J